MNESDTAGQGSIRVIVADDHTILRQGVCSLLDLQDDIEVVGEASDGVEALELLAGAAVDVVIMDMVMPRMNGLEATREIKRRWPGVKILILSMYDDDAYVQQVIEAGASGYVLKRVATEDLVQAIREVHSGASFLYPPIAAKLIDDYRRLARGDARPDTGGVLTPREQEVLRLIAEGNTNQDIADILGLSRKTVESHRGNIMRKLQLHDVTELVKYAIREGVVRLQ